ncbi:MAG: glycosyltransferase family 2 protein [Dokdonella sp.]|uniref:glycosyltransferase family 2 protein n=1 Tax=Dokdonella sp. TaxID=2291710 RepID=UPI0025B90F9C|nr:glycosyltransferase family 2 protein [Dokdonella sp.]MBZ0222364.1 glycosyltransferase family 2 protein [Dokdonella sp.]MCC7255009.1 glycosyltransferase family 2 protein [Dokdonella sp.]
MSATDPDKIVVVIPALNEERAIRGVVESVLAICPHVIVIDDGSTDATLERIADLPVTVIRHATPLGKGQGLRDGFRKALERGFDAVIAMDGDGQHLAEDIPRMLAAARAHPEHIVIGARIRNKDNQPTARRRANAVADWGISWGCGIPVADTQSGQRYYPRAALDLVDFPADDFVFEAALLIAATREKNIGVVSVPIDSRYHGEFRGSHFRPVRDVTRITWYTIKRVVHYGSVVDSYRRSHSTPPLIFDPPADT